MKDIKFKAQVENEISEFQKKTLDHNPSYAPTQLDVIKLVDLYWVDKFKDGDFNDSGWKRAFYNVIVFPTFVSAKMTDLDTKDIRIIAEEGASYYPAWIFGRDLKYWLKDKKIGQLLNEMVFKLPKYGSVVLKKVGSEIFLVPMANLAMESDVENLEDSCFVTETHIYTPTLLRKQSWKKEDIALAIKEAGKGQKIKVYERFGEIPGSDNNYRIITKEGVVLFEDKFDSIKDLYRKLDWDKIPGRMLGRGTVEKLFETQIQTNRVANYKTEGLHWTSKHIFQTRDSTFNKNLTTDVDNGEVLFVTSELTEVNNQEKNLAAYNSEEQRWDQLRRELTFSFAEVGGERPPAGTPLGSSVLQAQQASGFFDIKREDMGLFWKDIILEWIIPEFKKERSMAHKLMMGEFTEAEAEKIRNMFINDKVNQNYVDYILKNKRFPSPEETNLMRSLAEKEVSKAREIDIPANFYENIKYKVDVLITNEQMDVAARLATLQSVLGILSTNPGVLENPKTQKIFYEMLNISGISPVDLGLDDNKPELEDTIPQLKQGGSIAKSVASPIPTQLQTQSRV